LTDVLEYLLNSKYLSDPTEDVHVATENLMADFLREIRDIAVFALRSEEKARINGETKSLEPREPKRPDDRLSNLTVVLPERGAFITDHDGTLGHDPMRPTRSIHEDRDNGCM
jgi:vacuole morphology and inheritance protein 14